MQILENIPDSMKVAVSVSPPVFTVMGLPMETWTYILSAIVSLMFIIEKLPVFFERCKSFYNWMKERYGTSSK